MIARERAARARRVKEGASMVKGWGRAGKKSEGEEGEKGRRAERCEVDGCCRPTQVLRASEVVQCIDIQTENDVVGHPAP